LNDAAISNELGRMYKVKIVGYFNVISQHLVVWPLKFTKNWNLSKRCLLTC